MSASAITVGDKPVVLVDCSEKTPAQLSEVAATLREARNLMASSEENSVYIITDLTKSSFNPELVEEFNDFVAANTKYVKVSVLVGLSDHHKIIVSIFRKMYKRDFYIADSMEDAKAYLQAL